MIVFGWTMASDFGDVRPVSIFGLDLNLIYFLDSVAKAGLIFGGDGLALADEEVPMRGLSFLETGGMSR